LPAQASAYSHASAADRGAHKLSESCICPSFTFLVAMSVDSYHPDLKRPSYASK